MLSQKQINTILKYIIFFVIVYIFTCFLDKKSVYFYLFVIFVLALFCKLAFYSNTRTLVRISWAFIGLCFLALFADLIKNENTSFGWFFDSVIGVLAYLGSLVKSIFTDSILIYMFLFMVLATVYASILSQGNSNIGILGWILGIALGFCIWFFLSAPVDTPETVPENVYVSDES